MGGQEIYNGNNNLLSPKKKKRKESTGVIESRIKKLEEKVQKID